MLYETCKTNQVLYDILQNITCPEPPQVICPTIVQPVQQDTVQVQEEQVQNKINIIFWIALISLIVNVFTYFTLLYETRVIRKRIHSEIKFHGTTDI